MSDAPFQFHAPLRFFEKANAPKGRKLRIAGVVSTEKEDRQEETMLQNGLNWDYFTSDGWFNDNHAKGAANVLGHPDGIPKRFQKGEVLPDGETAEHNCTWAEGYLLDTQRGRATWENGRALKGTGRNLGFSIEGRITGRTGYNNKTVTSAIVRNIAITECPVGYGTGMVTLAKSLAAAQEASDTEAQTSFALGTTEKALTMGSDSSAPASQGPKTGEGAGRTITQQDLEKAFADEDEDNIAEEDDEEDVDLDDEEDEGEEEEELSKAIVLSHIEARFPDMGTGFAERATRALFTLNNERIMHSDLEKALAGLEDAANAGNPQVRHQELLQKSMAGTISPEENDELVKNLQGGGYGIQEDLTAALNPDGDMMKALDVSPVLQGQHDGIVAAFGSLGERLEKSEAQTHSYRIALGASLIEMGKMFKSMSAQIASLGGAPAGEVLSKGAIGAADAPVPTAAGAQPRALGNGSPQEDVLSKSQILEAMQGIMEGSKARGWKAECGEDITQATAKFETTGMMSKALQDEVADFVRKSRA